MMEFWHSRQISCDAWGKSANIAFVIISEISLQVQATLFIDSFSSDLNYPVKFEWNHMDEALNCSFYTKLNETEGKSLKKMT